MTLQTQIRPLSPVLTDLELAKVATVVAMHSQRHEQRIDPFAGLTTRNREVMSAYRSIIRDDTPQGEAARYVRDTLLARQAVRL